MSPIPKYLQLPVHVVNDRWEYFYGGAVPVADGAQAELVVESELITDPEFLARVTQKVECQCLSHGTELMVALSVPEEVSSPVFYLPNTKTGKGLRVVSRDLPSASTRFVPVKLGDMQSDPDPEMFEGLGGLRMVVTGLGHCELLSSTVSFPEELEMEAARSLNHAFTKLSERFETHRLAHTGSFYLRVFYKETNHTWYPLEYMKSGELRRADHGWMAAAWQAIEEQLGWCKFPRVEKVW